MGTRSCSIKKFKAASPATHTKAAPTRQIIIATQMTATSKAGSAIAFASGVILQNFTRALNAPEGA